jgi:hypothetical protein
MADDVKVKFGGDFTDVPKGAETAVQSAGTIMGKWFGDYAKGLKDKLASAFSLDSIVSKFVSGMGEQLEKFKEIDTLARKLNVTRVELQQFAKLGKDFNLDMETMGRSIAYANKTLGAAAEGNKQAQDKLMRMGFTQKEVTSGNLRATDVLYKLSEAYEKNVKSGNANRAANILAIDTTSTFGRAGADLVTVLKQGNEAMRERIKLMEVYSESEVKTGARLARTIERQKARFEKAVYGKTISRFGAGLELGDIRDYISENEETDNGIFGKSRPYSSSLYDTSSFDKSSEYYKNNPEKFKELINKIVKSGRKEGISVEDLAEMYSNTETSSELETNFFKEIGKSLGELVPKKIEEAVSSSTGSKALVASSLQEIGGGDIGSVMSGLGPNAIAENTLRTAVATEQIAGQQHAQPPPAKLR